MYGHPLKRRRERERRNENEGRSESAATTKTTTLGITRETIVPARSPYLSSSDSPAMS